MTWLLAVAGYLVGSAALCVDGPKLRRYTPAGRSSCPRLRSANNGQSARIWRDGGKYAEALPLLERSDSEPPMTNGGWTLSRGLLARV